MSNFKKALIALCITAVTLAAAACSKGDSDVEGRWQDVNTPEITLLIKEDVIENYWEDSLTATFPYELDGSDVHVDQHGDIYTLTLEDDALKYMGETLYKKI